MDHLPQGSHRRRILLLISRSGSFEREVLMGIGDFAREHATWQFVTSRHRDISAKKLRAMAPDGIIAHNTLPRRLLERHGRPCVLLTRTQTQMDLPCVTCDDRAIGALAADHLWGLGLRNFAFVGIENARRFRPVERYIGFTEQLQTCGHTDKVPHLSCAFVDGMYRLGESQAAQIVDLPRPLGLFVFNDHVAEDVAQAVLAADLHMPDQVAVIAVDNDEAVCGFTPVALSSVDPDATRIGYTAAQTLDAMLEGKPSACEPILIPPIGVVPRASTDVQYLADASVAAALACIRRHGHEGISVTDVADDVGVARTTLARRFTAAVGHSIGEEIDRQRTQIILDYLHDTDLPLTAIAERCGFPRLSGMTIYIRRRFGTPPSALRQGRPTSRRRSEIDP